ncbi:MAG: hypothetical protein AAFO69_03300, partial [Bacteroidota bacterium]
FGIVAIGSTQRMDSPPATMQKAFERVAPPATVSLQFMEAGNAFKITCDPVSEATGYQFEIWSYEAASEKDLLFTSNELVPSTIPTDPQTYQIDAITFLLARSNQYLVKARALGDDTLLNSIYTNSKTPLEVDAGIDRMKIGISFQVK